MYAEGKVFQAFFSTVDNVDFNATLLTRYPMQSVESGC
jgi:hypothetical protein